MNVKVLVSTAVAIVCGLITVVALGQSTVQSTRFQDVSGSTDRVDVFGKLEADSITALKGSTLVRFELVEEKSGERLAVLYDNPSSGLPANFPAASHARAAGTWDPGRGVFHSDRVLTKCPSKYEQERTLDRKTREAIARWQEQSGQLGS